MDDLLNWFHSHEMWLWGLGILSTLLFVFSLLLTPTLICRIPHNYFQRDIPPFSWRTLFTPLGLVRNTLGLIALLAGIAMLVLPGQGILTILLGLALLDFPRKEQLERKLVRNEKVLKAMNWFRRRGNVAEFQLG